MKILITGAAGFIGAATAQGLLDRGDDVVGIDNLNDYYEVSLKLARLERLKAQAAFRFERLDLHDKAAMGALFATHRFDRVVHLGAQAGVRFSLQDPHAYIDANLMGTLNVLEGCRHNAVQHLVYASSSSVYGAETALPYREDQVAGHPCSLYAATKRSNELMAHSYSSMFSLPTTGLRFFTVYGPWGRPDMALFLFTRQILAGEPIQVFNHGKHRRDFTYIDDIVEGVLRTLDRVPTPSAEWDGAAASPADSSAPYRIYNIGSNRPIPLLRYIEVLEQCLGRQAEKIMLPLQTGDVPETFADCDALEKAVGYRPTTSVETGVANFVRWYRDYHQV